MMSSFGTVNGLSFIKAGNNYLKNWEYQSNKVVEFHNMKEKLMNSSDN